MERLRDAIRWVGRLCAALLLGAYALAFGLFLLISCLGSLFHDSGRTWEAPLLKSAAPSPARIGTAWLVTDPSSLAGSDAWVLVSDGKRGASPIFLGGTYASDGSIKMQGAVWSGDGSVFAVRAKVGQGSGKGFKGAYQLLYVAGYDFRKHVAMPREPTGEFLEEPTGELSEGIVRLLQSRGGNGSTVFALPYMNSGRPLSETEAQQLRRLLPERQ
ncbi:MAG: hypothetical protein HY321_18510 [Armatimonadetes bacterium]|nr:hypothetical protein [Armatimonadota bacterium]